MPQKFKSFSFGSKAKNLTGLTRKEITDRKKKLEKEEAAQVLTEFVASFDDDVKNTMWVRGEVVNSDAKTKEAPKIYKPNTKLYVKPNIEVDYKARVKSEKAKIVIKKQKKKTQLELYKEELREKHQNLERQKAANEVAKIITNKLSGNDNKSDDGNLCNDNDLHDVNNVLIAQKVEDNNIASSAKDKLHSTNIYIGNLSPKVNEKMLCELFGEYGPLASIKIMWPRTDEEQVRCRNVGFVAFMKRNHAEKMVNELQGYELYGMEIVLNWGKTVLLPTNPFYVSEKYRLKMEHELKIIATGLPFNAHPFDNNTDLKNLSNAVVKVYIPSDRHVLCLINRVVEFVCLYGCQFEAAIMNKEFKNPDFKFLFVHNSPEHVYYRWRLYSVLQGDSVTFWRRHDFVMYKGGSVWRPPVNPGLSELTEKFPNIANDSVIHKIIESIETFSTDRNLIGQIMVLCIKRSEMARSIVELIMLAARRCSTSERILAFIYLFHDLLYNSQSQVNHAFSYRKYIQDYIIEIYRIAKNISDKSLNKHRMQKFKSKITDCFRAMSDWSIYPPEFLVAIQNAFIGLEVGIKEDSGDSDDGIDISKCISKGKSINDIKKKLVNSSVFTSNDDSQSGKLTDTDSEDGEDIEKPNIESDKTLFTTSKWTSLEDKNDQMDISASSSSDEDFDGVPLGSLFPPTKTDTNHLLTQLNEMDKNIQKDKIDHTKLNEQNKRSRSPQSNQECKRLKRKSNVEI
ncbi:Ser/Arg-rich domain protein [Intoshia linei]|uniref:Ser/Arg-rich domain protein n=1 Tax=Intoshia linei TaxID=1819745 RepID=A0A177B812_9BILA|nr:Ser/Arg-rich domain protein [Intoshia linei]